MKIPCLARPASAHGLQRPVVGARASTPWLWLLLTALAVGTSPSRAQAPVKERAAETADLTRAQRAAEAARRETVHAESSANQADARVRRAEDSLKAAQSEVDIARREQRAAQQRLSSARGAENRALRDLDAARPRSR